ncbi:hypothetical protein SAMN05428988_3140 [Chitinophaga sp. YR573]|uniref:hypothetical protein n=1 Tax=Chitinophaga sp. YR573 TaxID=1881040 RepID=UPI0008CA4DEE|nr:hypothetical protein [Chitinophaga sp. YR573]SEW20848.1 hypothetical protein SAMN05428988_3140 [Chitinophaga sp. YR573]
MKTFLLVILSICILEGLKIHGTYRMVDRKGDYGTVYIDFGDSTYVKRTSEGAIDKGKIHRVKMPNGRTTIYLKNYVETEDEDSAKQLIRRSWGNSVIEFIETSNDTIPYRVTFVRNLHITLASGRFIKSYK